MKIELIKINNFRSIEEAEIRCTDFNIFVGQNNSGKTNLFEAIEWFYIGKANLDEVRFDKDHEREVSVEVIFSNIQSGIENIQNESSKTKIKNIAGDVQILGIKRTSKDVKKRVIVLDGEEKTPGTGFDSALNDFLPKFEYVNTKQYYDAVAKFDKKAPIGAMLSDVLATILETNEQYKDFQEKFRKLFEDDDSEIKVQFEGLGNSVKLHLEKQFPDTSTVKFEVPPPIFEDLLKKFNTTIDDGIETSAEEKGDGMQRALMLAIIQAYADFRKERDDVGKSFLFFIDEAELHLHPLAQRNLKNVLLGLADDVDQVFINTHSSVFVADDHPKQSIFKVEKADGITEFDIINSQMKPYVVYELLGGSPADLLLPRNFLIVEGVSEVELISRVISRFYCDQPEIQIIPACGDTDQAKRTINAIEKISTPLRKSLYKDRLVILCDKPSSEREGGVKQFIKENKTLKDNGQIFFLDKPALEECYPDRKDWLKTHNDQEEMNGKKKRKLAIRVGNEIAKNEFETNLPEMKKALEACWEKAF
jgi:putative ATP-dependent endonuclease of the OLD family